MSLDFYVKHKKMQQKNLIKLYSVPFTQLAMLLSLTSQTSYACFLGEQSKHHERTSASRLQQSKPQQNCFATWIRLQKNETTNIISYTCDESQPSSGFNNDNFVNSEDSFLLSWVCQSVSSTATANPDCL